MLIETCSSYCGIGCIWLLYFVNKPNWKALEDIQVKLEGLKTRAEKLLLCELINRYNIDYAPLYYLWLYALSNSARCFASFKDMFYALFTFRAK